jgi:hypothetical protein
VTRDRCLFALAALLTTPAALAQIQTDVASAMTIEAKAIPYRVAWWLSPVANYVEITFSIDEHSAAFSYVRFQCEYLGEDGKKNGGAVISGLTRSAFKPAEAGRLVAHTRTEQIPGGHLTGAECHITEVRP